jgi:hypothetical protein
MLSIPSLPVNEKVYLADRTLVYADDLKVGDKILGIKVTQNGIKGISDVYKNIINNGRIVYDYEFCEATVYSKVKEDRQSMSKFNDKRIRDTQYIVSEPMPLKIIKDMSDYNSYCINNQSNDLSPFMIINMDELYLEDELDDGGKINMLKVAGQNSDNKFIKQSFNVFDGYDIKASAYSLSITNAHFYCTENFIIFPLGGK